jgi:hypothetical protein
LILRAPLKDPTTEKPLIFQEEETEAGAQFYIFAAAYIQIL